MTVQARPPVVVVGGWFPDPDRIARHYDGRCDVRFADLTSAAAVTAATSDADAIVLPTQVVDEAILRALPPTVRVMGRTGVGIDTIDLLATTALGLTLINQPTYGALEVASHAVALILSLQRKLAAGDRYVREGWSGAVDLEPLGSLDEISVGLVGCGRIGGETARMLAPIVGRVLTYDPYVSSVPAPVQRVGDLHEMLAQCQVLSLHAPLTDESRGLIGPAELAALPRGAMVVNVARGGLIDEDALADLLVDGQIGAAGLDVFESEPLPPTSRLLAAPNTILTPHMAAYSTRAIWRLATWTIDDVLEWLEHRRVIHGAVVVAGSR
jgi:D-3-phosphoglycerate dehydrogenase